VVNARVRRAGLSEVPRARGPLWERFQYGAVLLLGLVATGLAVRFVLPLDTNYAITLVILVGSLALASRTRILLAMVALTPLLGLIRRLASGDAGRIDFDPLLVVPLLLAVIVIAGASRTSMPTDRPVNLVIGVVLVLDVVAIGFAVTSGFGAIYSCVQIAIAFLLMLGIANGWIPDLWPLAARLLLIIAPLVGIYGVIQFYVLPPWDRAWMIAADFASIGVPEPQQFRVFGASEAPGAYAAMLGLCIALAMQAIITAKGLGLRLLWLVYIGILFVPTVLSGVRAVLVSLLVAGIALALIYARGLGRVAVILLLIAGAFVVSFFISQFDSESQFLTSSRYTNLQDDNSLTYRLENYARLLDPGSLLIPRPAAGYDGFIIDLAAKFAYPGGIAAAAFMALAIVRAIRALRAGVRSSAAVASIYLVVFLFAGDAFTTLFGLASALALGSVLRQGSVAAIRELREPSPVVPLADPRRS